MSSESAAKYKLEVFPKEMTELECQILCHTILLNVAGVAAVSIIQTAPVHKCISHEEA